MVQELLQFTLKSSKNRTVLIRWVREHVDWILSLNKVRSKVREDKAVSRKHSTLRPGK